MPLQTENSFIADVKQILESARKRAFSAVNTAMVEAYWLVGKRIIDEEQKGKERAEYGSQIVKQLSIELSKGLGKGFSETNIWNFRLFYLTFPDLLAICQTPSGKPESPIQQTLSVKLSWSHYQLIMRVLIRKPKHIILKKPD